MDNIQISEMTVEDLNSMSDVLLKEFDDFWTYSILKSELLNENSKYFIAKTEKKIIGFGGIWKACNDVHITNIVVKKDYRNNGIGNLILKELIMIGKTLNAETITLEVNENNIYAKKMYLKSGFKQVGLRKKYYNNKDNAIIMTLTYDKK